MKLALIYLSVRESRTPPMGLSSMAAYLERELGFKDTVIIDEHFENVHRRVKEVNPDLIGISAITLLYGKALRLAREIREYSKAQIMIGGVHISTMPESLKDVFDFGVIGEGEVTLKEIVAAYIESGPLDKKRLSQISGVVYKDDNGKIVLTPPRELVKNLDDIPYPDLRRVNPKYFRPRDEVGLNMVGVCAPIMTARGCPYRCVFCSTSRFWHHHRYHSITYVVENIRFLVEEFGVQIINIWDDLFVVNKKRLREFHDRMEQAGLLGRVAFTVNARSNLIDDDMCEIMKSINVKSLYFGFESGSDKVLKFLKVGTTDVETNKRAIETCRKHGLVVHGSVILGSPGETAEDMRLTMDFIDFAVSHKDVNVWLYIAVPYPQTVFWEEAEKRGKVSADMDWENEASLSQTYFGQHLLTDLGAEEFDKIYKEAQRKTNMSRLRLVLKFVLSNPLSSARLFIARLPYYLRSIYLQFVRY